MNPVKLLTFASYSLTSLKMDSHSPLNDEKMSDELKRLAGQLKRLAGMKRSLEKEDEEFGGKRVHNSDESGGGADPAKEEQARPQGDKGCDRSTKTVCNAYASLLPFMKVNGEMRLPEVAARTTASAPKGFHGIYENARLFDDVGVILQLKGYGGNMTAQDWTNFLPPGGDFEEGAELMLREMMYELFPTDHELWGLKGQVKVVVQYDGDKLEAKNPLLRFTAVLPIFMKVLKDLGKFKIKAVLCTKLTTDEKAIKFAEKCFEENGGLQILEKADGDTELCTVAFKTEDGIERGVRNSFGAAINRSFPKNIPRRILLFGGGGVIRREFDDGYTGNTQIVLANIKRGDEFPAILNGVPSTDRYKIL